ncbi:TadE family type IV pilus minor pilin [Microbacterium sp.]|uniref:TadE family type IV pilus minor pilin n=1 Tax=Microbacterium sp. TaxID=51671 RepID=UPI003F710A08
MSARRRLGDRGSVVAEFAVALPAVVLVLLLGAGALGVASRHVRLQDAAADAARLAARGEPDARVHDAVAAAAAGAVAGIEYRGDLVCVTASANAVLPVRVSATSCALAGGW